MLTSVEKKGQEIVRKRVEKITNVSVNEDTLAATAKGRQLVGRRRQETTSRRMGADPAN